MSELLAWDGPWSPDLIRLMLPVASEILAKREIALHNATLASVASLFSPTIARDYRSDLDAVLKKVREEQMELRGATKQDLIDAMAERLAKAIRSMPGMR